MTESVEPKYSNRQLALLRGEVKPADNNEWNYVQEHANDLLPINPKDRSKPIFSVTGDDLARSRAQDRAGTHAGYIGEALDRKED